MPEATAQKKFSCPACGAAAEWNPANQSLICPFYGTTSPAHSNQHPTMTCDNPNGIAASSPGLPSLRGYPGKPFPNGLQPHRGCINGESTAPTPLGLLNIFCRDPRVARFSQPWADCSNPFGIHADDNATHTNGIGIYPDGHASNPNGIEIIQPSVDAQRLRWVIAQTIHQL